MQQRVRLIDLTGALAFECNLQTDSEAIVFCNKVFIRSFTQGTWTHYREVPAERVRNLDRATVVNTSIPQQQQEKLS